MFDKEYLGDSVYANFDGYAVVLTTEDGSPEDPSNVIVLEPQVIEQLLKYWQRIQDKRAAEQSGS